MIKYFIEHKDTHQWLQTSLGKCIDFLYDTSKTPNYASVYSWTIDPHEANHYSTREQAEREIDSIWRNSVDFHWFNDENEQWFKEENRGNWIITEHEFVHYRL